MNRLRRFLKLPFRTQRLLIEAFLRLMAVSVLFRALSSSRVCRMWKGEKGSHRARRGDRSAEEICWAITTAARQVRGASCLAQSLVGFTMLQQAGYPAEIRVGVAKMPPGFQAHAWVYSEGMIVLGGNVAPYTELPIKY